MKAWAEDAGPRLNSRDRPIHMARLCTELNRALPADSILVADGGFAGHWTGLLYDTKKSGRHFIPDRGFASIGYGLPGGIGASLAAPGTPVVAITGDGGFNMMLGELETARRAGIGLTIVVVNNAASGYVKALQHAMFRGRYQSSDLVEMDYAAIALGLVWRGVAWAGGGGWGGSRGGLGRGGARGGRWARVGGVGGGSCGGADRTGERRA